MERERAAVLADRLLGEKDWPQDGDRDRVIERIIQMSEQGAKEHVIVNAAKSVRAKSRPVSLFMEVTSSKGRWIAAALAGAQIYPAPGVAPPREPRVEDEEQPQSWATMCKVHGMALYSSSPDEIPTRCSRCESEGDYSGRRNARPRPRLTFGG
ncbi:hypothetical protein Q8791_27275 [Nocardiopsis sp. CT-R113]|uniref:Uncharacterized protein n=1 Tax=Nocardiopsis codii TaxID=3065942 RepID=A0ABU7KFD8_9ACTN|nr:hypothetical protein [Nocardiopsis sp. CT-R113]MEE2040928.1 hypothetical protein [Nocardiopsis sp. CT-R113]